MPDLWGLLSIYWSSILSIISIIIAASALVHTVHSTRASSKRELVNKLRPWIVRLRSQLEDIENPETRLPLHHKIAYIKETYDLIKKESLDFLLDQKAYSIREVLEHLNTKILAIEKTITRDPKAPSVDHWNKFGDILSSQGNLKDDTSKLKLEVIKWLTKHP